ncbi:MAG: hypothetical protein HC830_10350 [Bacteroidetes bacterium]|nr:hypothetical protein [Bacteroidales bacterium]NJO69621.1 hypothetical protein [Bacteroidota bacterium]
MEQIILNIKDKSKLTFLMQLIKQLDFVEVESKKKKKASFKHDFFSSAGLWSNREIDAKDLRQKAWSRER